MLNLQPKRENSRQTVLLFKEQFRTWPPLERNILTSLLPLPWRRAINVLKFWVLHFTVATIILVIIFLCREYYGRWPEQSMESALCNLAGNLCLKLRTFSAPSSLKNIIQMDITCWCYRKQINPFSSSHYFCRLLGLSAYDKLTIWTQIRLLPWEQSDQGS